MNTLKYIGSKLISYMSNKIRHKHIKNKLVDPNIMLRLNNSLYLIIYTNVLEKLCKSGLLYSAMTKH